MHVVDPQEVFFEALIGQDGLAKEAVGGLPESFLLVHDLEVIEGVADVVLFDRVFGVPLEVESDRVEGEGHLFGQVLVPFEADGLSFGDFGELGEEGSVALCDALDQGFVAGVACFFDACDVGEGEEVALEHGEVGPMALDDLSIPLQKSGLVVAGQEQ